MITIFSIENEFSTIAVVKWLKYFGQDVSVINSNDDIQKLVKINNQGIFFKDTLTDRSVNLLDTKSCWWRRTGLSLRNFLYSEPKSEIIAGDFDLAKLLLGEKGMIKSETEDLRSYIFERIYKSSKINLGNPKLYNLNKLSLLDAAENKGLSVPKYEIVTNLNQIFDIESIGEKFVTKAISNGIYGQINNNRFYSYTELHHKMDYLNRNLNVFPSLIMEIIEKKYEVRSFYLDGYFYSMAIFSQANSQTTVDFRKYSMEKPNRMEPFKLPHEVELKLTRLFNDIGLNTGSVDLIVTPDDEYVFLEINPVGQYGMTSGPCNYDLDKLIAKYLINGNIIS